MVLYCPDKIIIQNKQLSVVLAFFNSSMLLYTHEMVYMLIKTAKWLRCMNSSALFGVLEFRSAVFWAFCKSIACILVLLCEKVCLFMCEALVMNAI